MFELAARVSLTLVPKAPGEPTSASFGSEGSTFRILPKGLDPECRACCLITASDDITLGLVASSSPIPHEIIFAHPEACFYLCGTCRAEIWPEPLELERD